VVNFFAFAWDQREKKNISWFILYPRDLLKKLLIHTGIYNYKYHTLKSTRSEGLILALSRFQGLGLRVLKLKYTTVIRIRIWEAKIEQNNKRPNARYKKTHSSEKCKKKFKIIKSNDKEKQSWKTVKNLVVLGHVT